MKEKRHLEKRGHSPVCFIDIDEKKHGSEFLGLPVFSFEDAQKLYSEFMIHVTLVSDQRYHAQENLVSRGFDRSRIVNYVSVEEHDGCELLEFKLLYDHDGMFPCCREDEVYMNEPPRVKWTGEDIESSVLEYIDMRSRIVSQLKEGEASECTGCKFVKRDLFSTESKLKSLVFGFDAPCQLSCKYCMHRNASRTDQGNEIDKFMSVFPINRFIRCLEEQKMLDYNTVVSFFGGELSINPRKNELLDAVKDYEIDVATNAVLFDSMIASVATSLNASVDAGTRRTYKDIKGSNSFEIVWGNLKKYSDSGVKTTAKYIFLEENSNYEDVRGFLVETEKANVRNIAISTDVFCNSPYTDFRTSLIIDMIEGASRSGINATLETPFFKPWDIEKIILAATSRGIKLCFA